MLKNPQRPMFDSRALVYNNSLGSRSRNRDSFALALFSKESARSGVLQQIRMTEIPHSYHEHSYFNSKLQAGNKIKVNCH